MKKETETIYFWNALTGIVHYCGADAYREAAEARHAYAAAGYKVGPLLSKS